MRVRAALADQDPSALSRIRRTKEERRLEEDKTAFAQTDHDSVPARPLGSRVHQPAHDPYAHVLRAAEASTSISMKRPATARQAQSVDRAHRIGQARQVFDYRLIARDRISNCCCLSRDDVSTLMPCGCGTPYTRLSRSPNRTSSAISSMDCINLTPLNSRLLI